MTGQVFVQRDDHIAVLVISNPPVNAGSHHIRKALLAAIAEVEANPRLTGAVLIGDGNSFIAGSDLKEFDLRLDPPQTPQVIAALESTTKPFVAALHGAALGGGYEIALGCDARIAAPGTVVGLPEVTLGIIPGAGGAQKLPRLVGKPKALRHIFFAERAAARGNPDRSAKPVNVAQLGVVGSGTMGAGIATAILQSGKPVILIDTNADALEKGCRRIVQALERAVTRGKMTAEAAGQAQARLTSATNLEALAPCDVVIEAVFEDLDLKADLFGRLDAILGSDAILASNTSYLDIDAMAAATTRPDRVIGLHFFSPAHVMKLLEVVRGNASSDSAMATGFALARMLGKQPVEAANAFGFIGNRIYAAYRAACEFMLEDGAFPHEIDAALEAFGFAMGPCAVADMSGLDIAWHMRRQTAAQRSDADRYVDIPDRLCEAGRFGQKTGAGYYRYDDGTKARDPWVEDLIRAVSQEKGIMRTPFSAQDIQTRALAAIVNEAALVVAEGVAIRPEDIDVVLVNGFGFPRWRGGPVHWARQQDADALSAACAAFAVAAGPGRKTGDFRVLELDAKDKA
ncbi:3-hydroxyacyl-CoA dehydrogenase NAD-binding domain-containing protein [Roseibaca sp. V10]|uniref:3-hydroxyacyl-CoA dehydrogenase NAD-binding domain-containing protein n=1 Tax=Roseinatronobacter domitianus TaxID=2940293 RepID=A0ABT0M6C3_9RHOB|nr:3-hydroxyacyl-CoA dehydrogenase NAD-binding domain-containing protein [Roseibaca domitiana]MCL1629935.1 3-hydroxyacyl-CoA dehydrogenase NAD-binding domain-containing protein [Roseibaca domitiana]